MMHLTKIAPLVCLVIGVLPVARSGAQATPASPTATVTLVSKPNLPRGAKVLVERRARLNPRDVILVDLDRATPRDLAAAVQALAALRRHVDDDRQAIVRASPKSYTPPADFDDSHFGRQMKAGLVRLLTAPETAVPGVGWGRAVTITVSESEIRQLATQD